MSNLISTHTYSEARKWQTIDFLENNDLPLLVELTDEERERIKSMGDAFWSDVHFKVYDTALIIYADTSKCDFEYVHCLGVYESQYIAGRKLYEALNCPEYRHRPTHSAKRGSVQLLYGGYKFSTPTDIDQRCKSAIKHYLKNKI